MFLENSSRGAYRRALRCFDDFEANASLQLGWLNFSKQQSWQDLLMFTKTAFVGTGVMALSLWWASHHVAWINNHVSILSVISMIMFLGLLNAVAYAVLGLLSYLDSVREFKIFNRLLQEIAETKSTNPEGLENLKAEYAKEGCR